MKTALVLFSVLFFLSCSSDDNIIETPVDPVPPKDTVSSLSSIGTSNNAFMIDSYEDENTSAMFYSKNGVCLLRVGKVIDTVKYDTKNLYTYYYPEIWKNENSEFACWFSYPYGNYRTNGDSLYDIDGNPKDLNGLELYGLKTPAVSQEEFLSRSYLYNAKFKIYNDELLLELVIYNHEQEYEKYEFKISDSPKIDIATATNIYDNDLFVKKSSGEFETEFGVEYSETDENLKNESDIKPYTLSVLKNGEIVFANPFLLSLISIDNYSNIYNNGDGEFFVLPAMRYLDPVYGEIDSTYDYLVTNFTNSLKYGKDYRMECLGASDDGKWLGGVFNDSLEVNNKTVDKSKRGIFVSTIDGPKEIDRVVKELKVADSISFVKPITKNKIFLLSKLSQNEYKAIIYNIDSETYEEEKIVSDRMLSILRVFVKDESLILNGNFAGTLKFEGNSYSAGVVSTFKIVF